MGAILELGCWDEAALEGTALDDAGVGVAEDDAGEVRN